MSCDQDGCEICSSCSKPNTSYSRRDSSYCQFMSRVTGIFEIWTAFWNLHVSFEHRQRGFKVPAEVSLFYWRYNFSLHYNIKYFKNKNCFPSILNLFFFFCYKCVFLGKISREMFNIPFTCRTLQREIRMFISFSEILVTRDSVTWIDCKIIAMFHGLHDLICFRLRYVRLSSYRTRQILNLSTGDSVNERVIQAVRWTFVSRSFAPDVNGGFSSHCPEKKSD